MPKISEDQQIGFNAPGNWTSEDLFPSNEVFEYCSFQELLEECKPPISPSIKYEPITRSHKKRVVRVTARRCF